MEETAALFDGEQPPQDLAQMGGEAATMTMGRADAIGERLSVEKDGPIGRDFLEMRDVSAHGSSADELSAEVIMDHNDTKDHRHLYRIDEHLDAL